MDKLVIERSQPVQGQIVEATLVWNDVVLGELMLPFTAWLKFKRVIEKGLELDAREGHGLGVKISFQGKGAVAIAGKPYENTKQKVVPYRGGISNLAAEDDEDKADLAAIAAAEAGAMPPTNPPPSEAENVDGVTEGLIRSLRRSDG